MEDDVPLGLSGTLQIYGAVSGITDILEPHWLENFSDLGPEAMAKAFPLVDDCTQIGIDVFEGLFFA